MKGKNIFKLVFLLFLVASCGKESPFNPEPENKTEGQLSKSAFSLKVLDASVITNVNATGTRADAQEISLDDFKISIFQEGISTPKLTYLYKDMPEIITLLYGEYYVVAEYGENVDMGWDKPYYRGESGNFIVKGGEITDDIGVISCKLDNVKVSIDFGSVLLDKVENPNVEVKVCADGDEANSKGLVFTESDARAERCGYFKYEEGVTLIASFNGTMEGDLSPIQRNASIKDLKNGRHYKITFKIHVIDEDPGGGVRHNLDIDADLIVRDLERNIDLDEDELLLDDERPREDDPNVGEKNPPVIKGIDPINLDIVNVVKEGMKCELNVTSSSPGGFTGFTCDIVSEKLNADELKGVGLSDKLDLINPGDYENSLTSLGFPVKVGGKKEVKFVLTKFLPLLSTLGEGEHNFILRVTDSYGTTEKTLKLKVPGNN